MESPTGVNIAACCPNWNSTRVGDGGSVNIGARGDEGDGEGGIG